MIREETVFTYVRGGHMYHVANDSITKIITKIIFILVFQKNDLINSFKIQTHKN